MERENHLKSNVERFCDFWETIYVDFWWRKRYNVPFGSRRHREMNFFDMLADYTETKRVYEAVRGDMRKDVEPSEGISQSEIDEDYDNIDI